MNQSEKLLFQIEVNPIYNLLTSINPNVRFSFIVVSKRINTKFFLKKDDKYFNPEAGTVVDDVVVSLFRRLLINQASCLINLASSMNNSLEIFGPETAWLS